MFANEQWFFDTLRSTISFGTAEVLIITLVFISITSLTNYQQNFNIILIRLDAIEILSFL